jgi:hypothetical protein
MDLQKMLSHSATGALANNLIDAFLLIRKIALGFRNSRVFL